MNMSHRRDLPAVKLVGNFAAVTDNHSFSNLEEQQASTETGAPPAPLAQQTASVPAPAPAPSSNWQLTLRVVSATTGRIYSNHSVAAKSSLSKSCLKRMRKRGSWSAAGKMLKSVPVQILNRNKALLAEAGVGYDACAWA